MAITAPPLETLQTAEAWPAKKMIDPNLVVEAMEVNRSLRRPSPRRR